ncbi:hypothetical protein SUDANB121_01169 [Nocardiopsis dassonvillei]|uniref:DUF6309 family protein n=1 Tax=Nocardiopsis dassonvillei TaxID=2014 RepID=UPI003F56A85C
MRTFEALTTDDVVRRFRDTHPAPDPASRACNEYAEGVLRLAGEQRGGRWHRVALTGDDVAAILLPWHVGEYGEREPVPPAGATVAEAVRVLREWRRDYADTNPDCWSKLSRQAAAPYSPLFLSAGAIDHPYYERVERRDAVTHLDGLHRMLAWSLWDRLPEEAEAYLAG